MERGRCSSNNVAEGRKLGIIYGTLDLPERQEKYQKLDKDVVDEADVCIIGSGAAGAVLAKELAEKGRSVILLERGGYFEGKDMNQREQDMMPLLWKNAGFNFDDSLSTVVAQGSCLGGSTIINDAVCFDPPERVKKEWTQLGVNFTDTEWKNNNERVNISLSVSEVTDDEINRNSLLLIKGAQNLRLKDHRKNHRNCINCMQCGFCHLGCHYETKQDVLQTYIHQGMLQPDEKFRVYCNCYVDKLVHSEGVVNGVEGTFRNSSEEESFKIRINSKIVIISAGTIASSKILLRNGIAQETAGRDVSLHPAPLVIGDFDLEIKANEGVPMAYTIHDFGVTRSSDNTINEHNYTDGEFLIEGIFLPIIQLSMGLSVGPAEHTELIQRYNNLAAAGILTRDENSGRVSLTSTGRASLAYTLSKRDAATIAKGMEIIAKMWFSLGAKRVITTLNSMPIISSEAEISKLVERTKTHPEELRLGSAHPQGGNKIGTNPAESVVDSDCKVHGFKNLFCVDASVFPTSVGVNPQITVMTVASIIADRISEAWESRYDQIDISTELGHTCSVKQPMFCRRENLSELFYATKTKFDEKMLVNSENDSADDTNWKFDAQTMMITNNTHWKGFFPRDGDIINTASLYFGGFWKSFTEKNDSGITGTTHPFETPVYAANKAFTKQVKGFGKVIMLDYTEPGFSLFHDVLKFVDEDTILGQAFFNNPEKGRDMMTFAMARKYPFEFMTEEDHDMVYNKMAKPTLESMVGVWEGQLVSDSAWSPTVFRFRFYFDGNILKNQYLFGNVLSGTAILSDKADHVRMDDETEIFHDEIRSVNKDILVGRYYSPTNDILKYLPRDASFMHSDPDKPRFYLPYVLKRVGTESAYKETRTD